MVIRTSLADHSQEALQIVGDHLANLPVESSFAWTPQQPTRRSFWLACHPGSGDIVTDPRELAEIDGDPVAGRRGLDAVNSSDQRLLWAINYLVTRSWSVLVRNAINLGVIQTFLRYMTLRARFVSYSGPHPGIGTHFDGNFLSAVTTNRYGLVELGYDGSVTWVSPRETSVMAGSSAHRLARFTTSEVKPRFHLVAASPRQDGPKISVAAFLNLPDKTTIPSGRFRNNTPWFHDVNQIKQDDGPDGSLRYLWEQQADALGITVDQLVRGEVPGLSVEEIR